MDMDYTDVDLVTKSSMYFYGLTSIKKTKTESTPLEALSESTALWKFFPDFMKNRDEIKKEGLEVLSEDCTKTFLSTMFNLLKTEKPDPSKILSKPMYVEIGEPFRITAKLNCAGFNDFLVDIEGNSKVIESGKAKVSENTQDKCIWTNNQIKKDTKVVVYVISEEGPKSKKFYPISYSDEEDLAKKTAVIDSVIFSFKIEEFILSEIQAKKKKKKTEELISDCKFPTECYYKICVFNTILKKAFCDF